MRQTLYHLLWCNPHPVKMSFSPPLTLLLQDHFCSCLARCSRETWARHITLLMIQTHFSWAGKSPHRLSIQPLRCTEDRSMLAFVNNGGRSEILKGVLFYFKHYIITIKWNKILYNNYVFLIPKKKGKWPHPVEVFFRQPLTVIIAVLISRFRNYNLTF